MPDKFDELEKEILETMKKVYSENVIDHAMNPRNTNQIANPDGFGSSTSACGETMEIRIKTKDGKVTETSFWTNGCSSTVACGSIASELVRGRDISRALTLNPVEIIDALNGLPEGNHHCALLAASAVKAAAMDYISIMREPWKKTYRKC